MRRTEQFQTASDVHSRQPVLYAKHRVGDLPIAVYRHRQFHRHSLPVSLDSSSINPDPASQRTSLDLPNKSDDRTHCGLGHRAAPSWPRANRRKTNAALRSSKDGSSKRVSGRRLESKNQDLYSSEALNLLSRIHETYRSMTSSSRQAFLASAITRQSINQSASVSGNLRAHRKVNFYVNGLHFVQLSRTQNDNIWQ